MSLLAKSVKKAVKKPIVIAAPSEPEKPVLVVPSAPVPVAVTEPVAPVIVVEQKVVPPEEASAIPAAAEELEPLWAQGASDDKLRAICKSFRGQMNYAKIDTTNMEKWSRKEMIDKCDYLNIHPQFRGNLNILRWKCSGGVEPTEQIMKLTEPELVSCIASRRALKFLRAMHIKTSREFQNQIETYGLPGSEKDKLMTEFKASELQFHNYFNRQVDLDGKTMYMVSNIADGFRKEFENGVSESIDALKASVIGEPTGQPPKGWRKWIANAWKIVAPLGKAIWKIGIDLTKFILTHPATARMIFYVALTVKRRICREVSIYFGKVKYEEKTLFGAAKDKASDLLAHGNQLAAIAVTNWINNGFAGTWLKVSSWMKSNMSGLIGASLTYIIPGFSAVQGGIDFFIGMMVDISGDAMKMALEVELYKDHVGTSFRYLINLFWDQEGCYKEYTVTKIVTPEISSFLPSFLLSAPAQPP